MATAESMKILTKKSDSRLDMLVPSEMKKLVVRNANKDELSWTTWVKMAIIEKHERDNQAK
ncbi:hypothetical protein [Sunxiuqinia sp. sy24]|uniref:hypothetical protein n=1 Tax=Sunxiuqinia sp. sy24 TaxID=3461495 RepID=UPI004046141C